MFPRRIQGAACRRAELLRLAALGLSLVKPAAGLFAAVLASPTASEPACGALCFSRPMCVPSLAKSIPDIRLQVESNLGQTSSGGKPVEDVPHEDGPSVPIQKGSVFAPWNALCVRSTQAPARSSSPEMRNAFGTGAGEPLVEPASAGAANVARILCRTEQHVEHAVRGPRSSGSARCPSRCRSSPSRRRYTVLLAG